MMNGFFLALIVASDLWKKVTAECLSDPALDAIFAGDTSIPREGSCCQSDVCNIPCPVPVDDPAPGYGVAVGVIMVISFALGVGAYVRIKGKASNYFVAGHSLSVWMVAITLAAAAVDSNALLGNVDLAYKYHFYDGAAIPIGLGLSLFLNGIFLAGKINAEAVLTLPDVLARRYGKVVEVLVSLTTITSFTMLLAGNLVGIGVIQAYVWNISVESSIWIGAAIVWGYTVCGGLYSVAYTDVVQCAIGWSGVVVAAFWFMANAEEEAPVPSVGFPGYIYPNDEICQLYEGVPCTNDAEACCYNTTKWCDSNGENCTSDNGAFPVGDVRIHQDQMTNALSVTPYPNAILWNWATIFILGFGNLGALDFQSRCLAGKNPRAATVGCFVAGSFTIFLGIPFAYLGSITRYYYGPDSIYAEFEADSCSTILGLPTCAEWLPDEMAFPKLATQQAPGWLGGWCLVGIVAASLSTASGAILAMGTVFSHNIARQLDQKWPHLITDDNLLFMARVMTIPFAMISACLAAFYRETGYLLIVAFDITLASIVAPLFGCFYTKNPSPRAAFLSIAAGAITRVCLEFTIPKDGSLILPYNYAEFYDYGTAASANLPTFVDPGDGSVPQWDPASEPCEQEQFKDYTGVDSLSAFLVSILVFCYVQYIEHVHGGKPLFTFPGMTPYDKGKVEIIDKTLTTGNAASGYEQGDKVIETSDEQGDKDDEQGDKVIEANDEQGDKVIEANDEHGDKVTEAIDDHISEISC